MRYSIVLFTALAFTAGPSFGQVPDHFVVPVAAFNYAGNGGNVWSSELFAINLGPEPADLEVIDFIPGEMEPLTDPSGCDDPRWTLNPGTSFTAPADLGLCARSFVGALVLRVGSGISVRSRIVNHGPINEPRGSGAEPLRGFGQEIPVRPLPAQSTGSVNVVLWPMVWHWNTCTNPRAFDSYAGVVNLGDVPGFIVIGGENDNAAAIVDGVHVPFGTEIEVPAHSWGQYRLFPYNSPFSDCRGPEAIGVSLRIEGPLLVYGSVVDRASQDPRTVLPVIPPSGATHP